MKIEGQIRRNRKEDNRDLARIIRNCFEEHDAPRSGTVYSDPTTDDLFSLFSDTAAVLWVAEMDHKTVGCCGIYPTPGLDPGVAELVKYYLAPEARGLGIGKALLKKSIRSARELAYRKLYLESLPEFAKAISIYEGLGFRSLEKPLGRSGHSSCTIWMLLDL